MPGHPGRQQDWRDVHKRTVRVPQPYDHEEPVLNFPVYAWADELEFAWQAQRSSSDWIVEAITVAHGPSHRTGRRMLVTTQLPEDDDAPALGEDGFTLRLAVLPLRWMVEEEFDEAGVPFPGPERSPDQLGGGDPDATPCTVSLDGTLVPAVQQKIQPWTAWRVRTPEVVITAIARDIEPDQLRLVTVADVDALQDYRATMLTREAAANTQAPIPTITVMCPRFCWLGG